MSRAFWVMVGAVGGIAAYRKGTAAVGRARELGPLGTAQAVADGTSRLAGSTARGLGRLQDVRDRRSGRLLIGTTEPVHGAASSSAGAASLPSGVSAAEIPPDWVPLDSREASIDRRAPAGQHPAGHGTTRPAATSTAASPAADAAGAAAPRAASTVTSTPRTTRPRRD